MNGHTIARVLAPLKPVTVDGQALWQKVSSTGYFDEYAISFEDGSEVVITSKEIHELYEGIQADAAIATMAGIIPRDISAKDFTDIAALAFVTAKKEEQNK